MRGAMRTDVSSEPRVFEAGSSDGNWSSTVCECCRDEETCWWGTWCCWLLNARNVQSFELGSSLREVVLFWAAIFLLIVATVAGGILGLLLVGLGAIVFFALRRTLVRSDIRDKYGLHGSFADDVFSHFCCTCCTVCQEGREVKFKKLPMRDYCSGELLRQDGDAGSPAIIGFGDVSSSGNHGGVYGSSGSGGGGTGGGGVGPEVELVGRGALNSSSSPLNPADLSGAGDSDVTFAIAVKHLSKLSRIILYLCGTVALAAVIILSATKRARNIAVLLLVFVQPLLVLYFLYWKYNRTYASLDYVIKLFAVGFWFTTFQSVVIEGILEVFIMIFIFFLKATIVASGAAGFAFMPLGGPHTLGQRLIVPISDYLFSAASAVAEGEGGGATGDESSSAKIPHPIIFLAYTFLTAFLLAAGTEETMKHFVVRCCQFPGPLRSPQAVMVYLLSGALGFATSENIEYVFGMSNAKGGSVSAMEEQLIVLAMRVLMPVHLICAVLQSVELSKHLFGQRQFSLVSILMPSIILHGTFDFVLFFIGGLNEYYGIDNIGLDVLSLILPIAITVGGIYWAYHSYKSVLGSYGHGWHPLRSLDVNENHHI